MEHCYRQRAATINFDNVDAVAIGVNQKLLALLPTLHRQVPFLSTILKFITLVEDLK